MPEDFYVNDSFTEGEFLKREIFIEKAEKAAIHFENNNLTSNSLRTLFYMLKSADNKLKQPGACFGEARETLYKFMRQVDYNVNRDVIKLNTGFRDFARAHVSIAEKNKEEFHGFVEFITSIVARLKTK
ncbi:MAG: type III-A CRISPR-associated protein Csm2 [Planctomycetes bacterium]|nr:type III-A CRISPR-associated protein Csm2 [Planctomycetota bacterium]